MNREVFIEQLDTTEITVDKKTGLESLQFPVYVQRREMGKEPSYN